MKGTVRPPLGPASAGRCTLDLERSDAVTVLETDQRRIVYEGAIFDANDEAIVNTPALLDSAFGCYTYVWFEKQTGEVVIGTDRLGFAPLYYAVVDGVVKFSSSIGLLKQELDRVTPDMDAWDEILLLGDIIGSKTVIKEIQRLQWGTKILINAERIDFVSVWQPDVPSFTSRTVYIERNNELLLEASRLTTSLDRNRIVALTGGQDSRRLAATARAAGVQFEGATQEFIGDDDKDKDSLIAEAVARELDVRHTRFAVPDPDVMDNDRRLKDHCCGYESDYHAWAVNFVRGLPRRSVIYDGIVGDVTVNGHYFRAYPDAISKYDDVDYLAQQLCGDRKSFINPSLLSTPVFERVRTELDRLPASPHRLTFFFILNHTRRNIGSWMNLFGLFDHVACTPYLYYPFFLQSLSLEPAAYLEHWMQNECLRALNPRVSEIPSTRDPVPPEYLLDLSAVSQRHATHPIERAAVRDDTKHYLPGVAARHHANELLGRLPLLRRGTRWDWASTVVGRFSEFLDWVEDTDTRHLVKIPAK